MIVPIEAKSAEVLIGVGVYAGNDSGAVSRAREEHRRTHMEAYCLKCRTQREMKDATAVTMKNGKPATKGTCPVCGTGMYKIGKAK
jgi:hypothetical protein